MVRAAGRAKRGVHLGKPRPESLRYHAYASVLSNGVWFLSQFILIASIAQIYASRDWLSAVITGVVYTAGTMTGSLAMHWFALNKLERKISA